MLHLFFFGRSFKTHDGVSLSSYFLISSFSSFYFFFWFLFFPVLLLKDLTRRLWVFQSIFFSVVVVCAPPISSASLLGLFCSTPFGGSMPLEFLRFFLAPEDFVCDSHLKPFPGHLFYDPMVSPRHQPLRGGVCGCTGKISRQLPGRDVDIFTC